MLLSEGKKESAAKHRYYDGEWPHFFSVEVVEFETAYLGKGDHVDHEREEQCDQRRISTGRPVNILDASYTIRIALAAGRQPFRRLKFSALDL